MIERLGVARKLRIQQRTAHRILCLRIAKQHICGAGNNCDLFAPNAEAILHFTDVFADR